jgi:hypothetical protein
MKHLLIPSPPHGFFSCLATVIAAIDAYERGHYSGVSVDFNGGTYLDAAHGSNWWNYCFEPLQVGHRDDEVQVLSREDSDRLAWRGIAFDPRYAHGILRRHVRVRPDIVDTVAGYASPLSGAFVIGVHYGGTDKAVEVPPVPFDTVLSRALREKQDAARAHPARRVRFVVASDEHRFLSAARAHLGDDLVVSDAIRSHDGRPVHAWSKTSKLAEGALVDCLLLARADVVIRTSSNLSLFASFFNPAMTVIRLNTASFEQEADGQAASR